jgi:hypothetical protein
MARAASARLFVTEASRSRRSAVRTSTAMTTARSTDGDGPTTSANPITMTIAVAAPARRGTRKKRQTAQTDAAKIATLKPETART